MPRFVLRCVLGFLAWALTVLADAGKAVAEERLLRVHLDWNAPLAADCPEMQATVDAVEARLSRRVFHEPQDTDVILTVAIRPKGRGWQARLEMLDHSETSLGTREVETDGPACSALTDVLPIVIALLVDASRSCVRLTVPSPPRQVVEARSPSPEPSLRALPSQPARSTRPFPSAPDASPWRLGWVVLADGTYGILPRLAPGASLAAMFEPPIASLPIELWLGLMAPTSSDGPSGAELSLVHAGVQACPNLWQGTTRGAACVGLGAGRLQVNGQGFDVNRSEAALYLDARTHGQLDIPFSRPWFLRLELGVLFPLVRRRFVGEVEPGTEAALHRPAIVAPRAALGVGAGFL